MLLEYLLLFGKQLTFTEQILLYINNLHVMHANSCSESFYHN